MPLRRSATKQPLPIAVQFLPAFREVEDQLAIVARLDEQEVSLRAQRAAVADAERSLLSVDLALLQLKADKLTALVALYQALGGAPQTDEAAK